MSTLAQILGDWNGDATQSLELRGDPNSTDPNQVLGGFFEDENPLPNSVSGPITYTFDGTTVKIDLVASTPQNRAGHCCNIRALPWWNKCCSHTAIRKSPHSPRH